MAGTAVAVSLAVFRKPIEDLYESAKGQVRRKLSALNAETRLKNLHKAITQVQKVKTMWKIDSEVKLLDFYYPSKVRIGDSVKTINAIAGISDQNFVIQGTVGQGKSIFLRYLCIKELGLSRRLPIFVELRRYSPSTTFREFLISSVSTYGYPCDSDVFEYLAGSGKLVLLLDGFDEIAADAVTKVINEIEILSQSHPTTQIIVTSRPESGIERSPHFRVYRLSPLRVTDHRPFLEKIIPERRQIEEILKALSASSTGIKNLLTTPLLLTLLVIVYNSTQEIPSSLSEFYESLFHTLLTRHDRTKPGYRRERASKLDDTSLKKLFEAFCYATRQQSQLVLKTDSLARNLEIAERLTGISCGADAFASDISKVACLMQQEGFQYHFIHKSVVEFHAACFVAHSSEEVARKFYERTAEVTKWDRWRQELEFLSQIDRLRYLKYFLLPSTTKALKNYGLDPSSHVGGIDVHLEKAQEALNNLSIEVGRDGEPDSGGAVHKIIHFNIRTDRDFTTDAIDMEVLSVLCGFGTNKRGFLDEALFSADGKYPIGDSLVRLGKLEWGRTTLNSALNKALEQFRNGSAELERQQNIGEFLNP